MTIVRLQGCPVGCVFCDTPESWALEGPATRDADLLAKTVREISPRWALITGGEPCWHDLDALTGQLRELGIKTALETSGVFPLTGDWDHVCVSPKPAGRLKLDPGTLIHAQEIKWLVGRSEDVRALEDFSDRFYLAKWTQVLVQPISGSAKATRLCLDALMAHPTWRLSVQTHKLLDIA